MMEGKGLRDQCDGRGGDRRSCNDGKDGLGDPTMMEGGDKKPTSDGKDGLGDPTMIEGEEIRNPSVMGREGTDGRGERGSSGIQKQATRVTLGQRASEMETQISSDPFLFPPIFQM